MENPRVVLCVADGTLFDLYRVLHQAALLLSSQGQALAKRCCGRQIDDSRPLTALHHVADGHPFGIFMAKALRYAIKFIALNLYLIRANSLFDPKNKANTAQTLINPNPNRHPSTFPVKSAVLAELKSPVSRRALTQKPPVGAVIQAVDYPLGPALRKFSDAAHSRGQPNLQAFI